MSALLLGGLRFALGSEPPVPELLAGHVVFLAVYLAPFALVLVALRWRQPAHQAAAWTAGAMLAFLGSLTAFGSGVTLILLPAAVFIGLGARRAYFAAERRQTPAILGMAFGLVAIGTAAWLAPFAFDDGRCWELVRSDDGRETWHSLPLSYTGPQKRGSIRSVCTTNITSAVEAALTLGLLSIGGLGSYVVLPRWNGVPILASEATETQEKDDP